MTRHSDGCREGLIVFSIWCKGHISLYQKSSQPQIKKKIIIFAGLLCWTAYCCTGSPLPVSTSYNPDYWKLDLYLWGFLLAFNYCDWQIHKLNSLKFNSMQVCIRIVIDLVTQWKSVFSPAVTRFTCDTDNGGIVTQLFDVLFCSVFVCTHY